MGGNVCRQGLYEDCAEKIAELFDKNAPCYLPHCTFNGRYQPTLGSLDGFGRSVAGLDVEVVKELNKTNPKHYVELSVRLSQFTNLSKAKVRDASV